MAWEYESEKGGEEVGWQEPKTNWAAGDRLNYPDYNRIKNNLMYIWKEACAVYAPFDIADMGDDMESEAEDWKVRYFNAFESNVDEINKHIFTQDYGIRQTFYENGPFIGYNELNRIEKATVGMKGIIDGTKAGKVRLSFRLGAPKGLKV